MGEDATWAWHFSRRKWRVKSNEAKRRDWKTGGWFRLPFLGGYHGIWLLECLTVACRFLISAIWFRKLARSGDPPCTLAEAMLGLSCLPRKLCGRLGILGLAENFLASDEISVRTDSLSAAILIRRSGTREGWLRERKKRMGRGDRGTTHPSPLLAQNSPVRLKSNVPMKSINRSAASSGVIAVRVETDVSNDRLAPHTSLICEGGTQRAKDRGTWHGA